MDLSGLLDFDRKTSAFYRHERAFLHGGKAIPGQRSFVAAGPNKVHLRRKLPDPQRSRRTEADRLAYGLARNSSKYVMKSINAPFTCLSCTPLLAVASGEHNLPGSCRLFNVADPDCIYSDTDREH